MSRLPFLPLIALAALGTLGGCSNTGIVPRDANTYMIAVRNPKVGFTSADDEKAEVYQAANEFCAKQSKKVETLKLTTMGSGLGRSASASLEFRCV
jgi:hypothetical protein